MAIDPAQKLLKNLYKYLHELYVEPLAALLVRVIRSPRNLAADVGGRKLVAAEEMPLTLASRVTPSQQAVSFSRVHTPC